MELEGPRGGSVDESIAAASSLAAWRGTAGRASCEDARPAEGSVPGRIEAIRPIPVPEVCNRPLNWPVPPENVTTPERVAHERA
jgi:hypothetical protein